ncbi:hypothetical protein [Corynebacterium glutamicum]|uniref:hypothetical protein n=1 Tax=Corynebacterium glutamicum TaxID=1718 RepID=UPI00155E349F|nr:hypothetical protein [Corynebacterium glutamicum]
MKTPHGDSWDLLGSPLTSQVMAPLGALQTLVGNVVRNDVARPGGVGVIPGQTKFGALQTTVDFFLQSDDMADTDMKFRKAFSLWEESAAPVVIEVDAGHAMGKFYWDLWLAQPLPVWSVRPDRVDSETITAQLFNPMGLARSDPMTGEGIVTVTNPGDVTVYPSFVYSGSGGVVETPSGAVFTLPDVEEFTVIKTDSMNLKIDGVFPEGVPPKGVGQWVLPPGVKAVWDIRVINPWS